MTLKHLAPFAALLLLVLSFSGFIGVAKASTITAGSYTLTNASVDGYSLTGTVAVNGSGVVTTTNLVFNEVSFANPGLPTFDQVSSINTYNGLSQNYLTSSRNSGQIALYFDLNADANGYYDLCLGSAQCGTASGTTAPATLQIYGFYNSATSTSNSGLAATNFSSGYLVGAGGSASPTVTPEPSSLVLMGSGILGLAGTVRRFRS